MPADAAYVPALHVVESGDGYGVPEPYIYPVPSSEPVPAYEQSYAPFAEEQPVPGPMPPWGTPMIDAPPEPTHRRTDLGSWTNYAPTTTPPQNGSTDSWS